MHEPIFYLVLRCRCEESDTWLQKTRQLSPRDSNLDSDNHPRYFSPHFL